MGLQKKKNHRSELLEIAQKVFDGRDSTQDFMVKKMGYVTMHYKPQPLSTLPKYTMIRRGDLYKRPMCLLQRNGSLEK